MEGRRGRGRPRSLTAPRAWGRPGAFPASGYARITACIFVSQTGEAWPTITQVPLVLHEERGARGTLLGHFDGNNPHGDVLRREPRVTCLFHGPNHYVTPSIYPVEHYPGWNYATVHVQARARPIDREEVRAPLFELAALHEPAGSGYVLRAEQRSFERFLDMVFGFELEILEARAIFKLAQDKGRDCAELAARHVATEVRKDVLPLLRTLIATTRSCVTKADIEEGDVVVVFGAGPVGLFAATTAYARAWGGIATTRSTCPSTC